MEVERQLQLVVVTEVAHQTREVVNADLTDGHPLSVVLVEHLTPAPVDLVHLVEIPVTPWRPAREEPRVVAQQLIAQQAVSDVDAKAVDTAIEPEAHHIVDRATDILVPPVQVRLLRQKVMHVVLAGPWIERPRSTALAEDRDPVVRRTATRLRIGPHVPIALRAVA